MPQEPIFPAVGKGPEEQRLLTAVREAVAGLQTRGLLNRRLEPGPVRKAGDTLAWTEMNRIDVGMSSGFVFTPRMTQDWVGQTLVMAKGNPSGLVRIRPGLALDGKTASRIDGSYTGIDVSSAGLSLMVPDGRDWYSRGGGGETVVTSSGSDVLPAGATGVFRLPATHNPVALYHFDGNLNDSSGNNLHLELEAGVNYYAAIFPGKLGVMTGGQSTNPAWSRLVCNASAAATMLALKDDISIEMIAVQQDLPTVSVSGFGVSFNDQDGTEAGNALWQFNASSANAPQWFQRFGAAQVAITQASGLSYPPPASRPLLVGARRASGIIKFYLDGKPYGTATSSGLTRPTGGGLSKLRMGGSNSGTQGSRYLTSGVKIVPTAMSDQAFLDDYNQSLGLFYGQRF